MKDDDALIPTPESIELNYYLGDEFGSSHRGGHLMGTGVVPDLHGEAMNLVARRYACMRYADMSGDDWDQWSEENEYRMEDSMSDLRNVAACPKCGGVGGFAYRAVQTYERACSWGSDDSFSADVVISEHSVGPATCIDCGAKFRLSRTGQKY